MVTIRSDGGLDDGTERSLGETVSAFEAGARGRASSSCRAGAGGLEPTAPPGRSAVW